MIRDSATARLAIAYLVVRMEKADMMRATRWKLAAAAKKLRATITLRRPPDIKISLQDD